MFLTDDILDLLPIRVYFKDADGKFVRVNRATAVALGLADPAAAVSKTDADFFGAAHADAARADERAVVAGGFEELCEFVFSFSSSSAILASSK